MEGRRTAQQPAPFSVAPQRGADQETGRASRVGATTPAVREPAQMVETNGVDPPPLAA